MAIDAFFLSLAEDLGPRAIGIVLSGTGSDGTLGLRAIKEHGGLAIAQSAETAAYDSMPRSAIATRLVDYVLSVSDMPRKLIEYAQHLRDHAPMPDLHHADEEQTDHLAQIFQLLLRRTGHDFSCYKKGTVLRRLQRRMRVLQAESVAEYADRLRANPLETDELFRDLLIGVTQFFRDEAAFDVLRHHVLPQLFQEKSADQVVRVWVPGCATGEEAYSLAILLYEHARTLDESPRIQIFATDIDEAALEMARIGKYPEGISEQVAQERLERFFIREGNCYVVTKSLREMCLFSPHNIIKDPPFSSLDLISCRNMLIYMENELQRKLIPLFHYALRRSGFLFLGPSENIANYSELFGAVDKRHRLYQARESAVRSAVDFPLTRPQRRAPLAASTEPPKGTKEPTAFRTLERYLLEQYAPAAVVTNASGEIAYSIGRCGRFLAPPVGPPSNNVIEQAREGLRLPLRTSLYRAAKSRSEVAQDNVRVQTNGHVQPIRLVVRPLNELPEQDLFLAIFQELAPVDAHLSPTVANDRGDAAEDSMATQLERELQQTREHLQATIEELETSNEELKSSNEELLSMNEEMQSSNEELQTSKEELQSVNEELGTVNAELGKKVEELDRANADLRNLFQSTQIPTIFLDDELRIKRFTPAATEVFRIINTDIDRPITDFAPRFAGFDIAAVVNEVLMNLIPQERELLQQNPARNFVMRVHPYRTLNNVIAGVVLTFLDVTELTLAREERSRLGAIVESSQDVIIGKDLDGIVTSWNAAAEHTFGYTAAEAIGKPITFVMRRDRTPEWDLILGQLRRGEDVDPFDTIRIDKLGREVQMHVAYSVIRNMNGEPIGIASISRDIRELKLAEAKALQRAAEVEAIMAAVPAVVWFAHDGDCRRITGNREAYRLLRMHEGSNLSKTAAPAERPTHFRVTKDGRELNGWELPVQTACSTGKPVLDWENDVVFDDGSALHIIGNAVPLLDDTGKSRGAVAAFIDITELKESKRALERAHTELQQRFADLEDARQEATRANQAKDRFIAVLSHELRNPLTPVLAAVEIAAMRKDELPAEFAELIDIIRRNIGLEARLIDDLLDLNRIVHGKVTLKLCRTDVAAAMQDVSAMCQSDAHAKQITIETHVVGSDLFVTADEARLRQIIWNLLNNAIRYSPEGSKIRLSGHRNELKEVTLEVADSGIGMTEELLGHVFEAFEQGDEPGRRSAEGLGLGLSICKALVDLLGGRISASSPGQGCGATFVVTFPVCEPAGGGDAPSTPQEKNGDGALSRSMRRRLLLVEDNKDSATTMSMLLKHYGFEVDTCGSLAEAKHAFAETSYDALISDLGLPDGSGLDLLRDLRANQNFIPAVALTGFGMDSDVATCKEAGFADHLLKPVDVAKLREILQKLLSETSS